MSVVKEETLDFYKLVERGLEGLPPELLRLLDNVAIVVDDWPDYSTPLVSGGSGETLYGLYEGVPLTERGAGYYGFLPDKITISRGPLERDFATHALEEQVRITVYTRSRITSASTRSDWRSWGGGELGPRRQREHRAADGRSCLRGLRLHLGFPQRQGVDGRRESVERLGETPTASAGESDRHDRTWGAMWNRRAEH